MNNAIIIARKEFVDLRRNWFLGATLGFLLIAVTLSVAVAASQFRVQFDQYTAYVAALHAAGSTTTAAAPQLFPLQLLRGSLEYIEILGALFAIVMGYSTIAKDKQRATFELLLTRPVGKYSIAVGKLLALAWSWAIAVLVIFSTSTAMVLLIGHAPLALIDYVRLAIVAVASWLYLMFWTALALGITSTTKQESTALIVSLVLWLSIVLILPQIGDTMDPDNQVPGGLFKSLQIAKTDEKAVLAHFTGFDNARNALEVASVTKHYERFGFAFLGIKDQYNQQSLGTVSQGVLVNTWTLLITWLAAIAFALRASTRKKLLRRST